MYNIEELKDRLLSELKEIAETLNVGNFKKLSKQDLIYKILDQQAITPADKLPGKAPEADAKPVAAPLAFSDVAPATSVPAPAGARAALLPLRSVCEQPLRERPAPLHRCRRARPAGARAGAC